MKQKSSVGNTPVLTGAITKEPWGDKHVYAPSLEEQQGVTAIIHKQNDTALLWFDRAIIADPSRGARVFSLCGQLNSPVSGAYVRFSVAARNRDVKAYQNELVDVISRHPELSVDKKACLEDAARYLNDLEERAPKPKKE